MIMINSTIFIFLLSLNDACRALAQQRQITIHQFNDLTARLAFGIRVGLVGASNSLVTHGRLCES
jgi:hypothetical protein